MFYNITRSTVKCCTSRCEGPAPGSGSTLDKTEEILTDIHSVRSNID